MKSVKVGIFGIPSRPKGDLKEANRRIKSELQIDSGSRPLFCRRAIHRGPHSAKGGSRLHCRDDCPMQRVQTGGKQALSVSVSGPCLRFESMSVGTIGIPKTMKKD